jgi:hypothetical protein
MKSHLKNERGAALILELIILAIVLLVAGVAVLLYYDHKKAADPAVSPEPAVSPIPRATAKAAPGSKIVLKELGISISLSESIKDLTYRYRHTEGQGYLTSDIADLSTASVSAEEPECQANGAAPPLGNLSRTYGQYPSNPNQGNASGVLIKQFSDFYIAYSTPQAACTTSNDVAQQLSQARGELNAAFSTIEQIEP